MKENDSQDEMKETVVAAQSGEAAPHLIGQIVCLELTVGGVLNKDWLVPDGGRGRGVVVHHGDGRLLRCHF